MEKLIEMIENGWFAPDNKELDKVKELLSKLFPGEKFSFKTDWIGEKQHLTYKEVEAVAVPLHQRMSLEILLHDGEFQKRLGETLKAARMKHPHYRPLRKMNLSPQSLCAEMLKIDQKTSSLPQSQRQVVVSLVMETISRYAS